MDLCFASAKQLARLIRTRKVSATEVMRAFIAQVERVNPKVNAIVTFLPEQALKEAKALDEQRVLGRHVVLVDQRAERGADALGRDEVLVGDG